MNQKICLIYTGGTIGMVRDSSGVLHPPEAPDSFRNTADDFGLMDYDFVPLLNKDSTNMLPADWTQIAKAIYSRLDYGYAGFVVVHGTDTMHYTAAALAFAFGGQLNLPVVLTGSQAPTDIAHGDARTNLLRAGLVARSALAEVVVSFNHTIYRGCRVYKTDERSFQAFQAPDDGLLGTISEHISLQSHAKRRGHVDSTETLQFRPEFSEGVLQIGVVPGLTPDCLLPLISSDSVKALIIQSFGAGNLPNTGEYNWSQFILAASQHAKPVVIGSAFPANSTLDSNYATSHALQESGAIPVANMTHASTMVKLSWILAQIEQKIAAGELSKKDSIGEIQAMLLANYVGEMD
ncbi:MAG: asparaginase domain-containing protein [Gammaproteobacteria bacterium]|nr:asparaginase domain-containing protein [Gammaproteobacteria bacterium]